MFGKSLLKSISTSLLLIGFLFFSTFLSIEVEAQHRLIGKKAPNVILPDRQGSLRKLSNLQGKYVLLHFWATWDGQTATSGHIEYKQLYNTFKSRSFKSADGFSIYSVAFDEDRAKWLNQIKKDGVTWTNLVIEMATYDSQYFDLYDFRSMPYTFLLDPNRKVISVNPSYEELYNTLNKSLKNPIPPPKAKNNTNSSSGSENTNTGSGNSSPGGSGNSGGSSGNSGNNSNNGTSTPTTNPTSGKVYKVQLGVFRNPKLSKFSKLNDLGTLGTEKISPTSSLSRVLLGNFTKSASKKTLKTVKSRGFSSAFLVTRDLGSGGSSSGSSSSGSSGNSSSGSNSNTGGSTSIPTISTTVYKIQLGVFRNPNLNAFNSLRSIGKLEVESTANGLKRVLLGSFARADKDAALKQVQAKGFRGFLIKRKEKTTGGNSSEGGSTTSPIPPTSSGNYKIQLGVFGRPKLSKFSKLNDLGTLSTERATSTLQRVMLGSFSASKAKEVLAKVRARGYKDAFVVKR